MASLARPAHEPRSSEVSNVARLDPDTAWAAFMRRDRAWDGRVIGAVTSTGIYCKPSCPARRPKREHVVFYSTGEEAREAPASAKNSTFSRFGRRAGQLGLQ